MENNPIQWIAYARVSTDDKGQTVDQQFRELELTAARVGAVIIDRFHDEKSGKLPSEDREGLRSAIKLARKTKAPIVCAKTDRLSRSYAVAEVLANDDSVSYKFLNAPDSALYDTTQRMIYFGFMSEGQRQAIRMATKSKMPLVAEALKRANQLYADGKSEAEIMELEPMAAPTIKRGCYPAGQWRLGTPKGQTDTTKAAAGRTRKANTNQYSLKAKEDLAEWLKTNPRNLSAAARFLNSKGRSTPRGGDFTPQAVKNLMERFGL